MQGAAAKGVALTAYVVVTFLADEVFTSKTLQISRFLKQIFQTIAANYADVIKKAMDYVYQTLETMDDVYSLAIAAYAAQLADYEHKDALFDRLDKLAKVTGNF